jgi:hypothetical protein
MIWLTWRQHRLEALACAGVLAVCAALLLGTGLHLHSMYDSGVSACQGSSTSNPACASLIRQFDLDFESAANFVAWLNFAPAVIGLFVGAPLLARELEHGTHRFVWTLGTTRGRWLAVKLAILGPAVVVAAALLTALFTWWLAPFPPARSPLDPVHFDFQGLLPGAYALFAFALGAACGAFLGRSVVAMAATLGGFLAVRLPVEFWLRAHYLAPITVTSHLAATAAGNSVQLTTPDVPEGAWVLSNGVIDASGNGIGPGFGAACPPPALPGGQAADAITRCLSDHGFMTQVVYQPADRYWPFQLIEAGIFVTLAAALIVVTVLWVRRTA